MATGWAFPTKENLNFARLCRLLIDGGTRVLRDVFDTIHSPSTLHTVLHSTPVHNLLQGLRARRVVTVHQWDKLYPKTIPVTSGGFDITLLFVLLRNICNLTPPPTGWDKLPAASDPSKEADLARIKLYRNELYGHITQTAVSDAEFEKLWTEICAVLIRRQPQYKPDIDRLKVEPMDIDDQKHFIKALEEWEETERSLKIAMKESEQRVMEKLEDMEEKLGSNKDSEQRLMGKLENIEGKLGSNKDSEQRVMGKLEDIEGKLGSNKDSEQRLMGKLEDIEGKLGSNKESEQRVMGKLEDIEGKLGDVVKDTKAVVGDNAQRNVERPTNEPAVEKDDVYTRAQEYTRKLKSSIKRQTESLPVLEGQTAVTIDDVFTNVTIQRVEKDQEKTKLGKKQFDVFQASSTTLKKCAEMFIWPENDDPNSRTPNTTNPKCILLTGKAGIGKSEFCRKMSRDWSRDGKLDFKFLFLLTYRQLSLLGHEELDLCDILNRSSLLDEQSMTDKGLLQYMIGNPEKVLIIFDGYDEYGYREEITGDFETIYPNDPHHKMPVPAMIAKIMKGKILNESVVMISSRPEEAQELLPEKVQELTEFPFDVRCEIKGFSPLQVQEFIQKYFKDDESMKSAVLEHIKMNEILLSFGHIPVMCYLMCYYLKWHMTQSKTTENLPNTRSELYYEVIKVFIKRHFLKYKKIIEAEVEEILHKLAELAIYLMREKKIIFTEEDMKKSFKFSEEELTNLKKSGLFDCCPGVKKYLSDKPPLEFVFSHVTIQEFLCALGFVEIKQLPEKEGMSEVIWTFMAGLLRRKNDEKLMDQLIEKIKPQHVYDNSNKVLTLHCLYEYRDYELSKRVINKLHDKYCESDGSFSFRGIKDIDCLAIGYFLYIVQLLTVKQTTKHLTSTQSFIVKTLYISHSSLSPSGVSVLCESLSNNTFVTGLRLWMCGLDDECVKIIAQTLNNTTINNLSLVSNPNITAKGIRDICAVLSDCSVEELNLSECGLDDECVEIIAQTLNKTRINNLTLMHNNITDEGVMCVCGVVSKRDCFVEVLNLLDNDKITAECIISVRKLLELNKPDVMIYLEPSTFGDEKDDENEKRETRRKIGDVTEIVARGPNAENETQKNKPDVETNFTPSTIGVQNYDEDDKRETKRKSSEFTVPPEIIVRGPNAEKAYQQAIKEGRVQVYRGRIMLIGQDRAGKTSLKKSLLGLKFDPEEPSTVGVDVDPSRFRVDVDSAIEWKKLEGTLMNDFDDKIARVTAEILNKERQDLERPEPEPEPEDPEPEPDPDPDVKPEPEPDVEPEPEDVAEENNEPVHDIKPLGGTTTTLMTETVAEKPTTPDVFDIKSNDDSNSSEDNAETTPEKDEFDRPSEEVTEKIIQYLKAKNLDEISSEDKVTVSIWDFAGQQLYYASHPVFLSPRAVYVLVYNLSKDLKEEAVPCVRQGINNIKLDNHEKQTNLEAILSWLVSVHSVRPQDDGKSNEGDELPYLRPPVVIVGTHADCPFKDIKEMEEIIRESLFGKSYNKHVVNPFIAVNNVKSSEDEGIHKLKNKAKELFETEPYMKEYVPVRWFRFEKVSLLWRLEEERRRASSPFQNSTGN